MSERLRNLLEQDENAWAIGYMCGCIAEWGTVGILTGMWVTEPCEKHAHAALVVGSEEDKT